MKAKFKLRTDVPVHDSEGNAMIVGNVYEMYTPAAKASATAIGIIWEDDKDYSFTYTGTFEVAGQVSICTPNVKYSADVIGAGAQRGSDQLAAALDGSYLLCPVYIASKFIRPVTGE